MADRSVDVLLIGGGTASASCSQQLRAAGFTGTVLLAGRELDAPYRRPPISKELLVGRATHEEALLPVGDGVEVATRTSVTRLDTAARVATLSTKETVAYGQALVATGANVRRLPAEGTDLEGIHHLRVLRNADALRADVDGVDRVGIVGGSFIACEVAASLATLGIASTLVFPEEAPLAVPFGGQVGAWVRTLLGDHGVEVLAGEQVERFEGDGERVRRIVCASGRVVDCQAVLVGVGAVPDVMLARASGLELGGLGGVACSASLRTSAPGVFAAGDMCEYASVLHGRPMRIEHHEVAAGQGRAAARAMLGSADPYDDVPYFWSDLAGWATLESVGPAVDGWDDEVVDGAFADGDFTVWYLRHGRLAAALTCGRPADLDRARTLLRTGAPFG